MYYDEDEKWNCFEMSGKISDYLEYKNVQYRGIESEGEYRRADTDN